MAIDWTDETIAQLRQLWKEGLSTREIGQRLHTTKNSVVGKAHRLHLPARPSPISTVNPRSRPASSTKPHPARTQPIRDPQPKPLTGIAPAPARKVLPPSPAATTVPTPHHAVATATGKGPCCWPMGHPGTTGFRFCDEPALLGRPYCAEHVRIAYVPRNRHVAAASIAER